MTDDANPGAPPAAPTPFLASRLKQTVQELAPASFAIVMATGIVSLAAAAIGMPRIAACLFWLNIGIYSWLWLLNLVRALWFFRRLSDDFLDPQRAPGFFTWVAGTCVLGSQFALIAESPRTAFALWGVGVVLWVTLTYAVFAALTVRQNKPPLDQGISGAWLLAVVAPQSVAVLTTLIAAHDQQYQFELSFIALSLWLLGGMLYVWLMVLIFYRLAYFRLLPADLAPPYWITMGAMAISTLAGSLLISEAPEVPYLESLLPFLKGVTVFYWASGTWWIPLLVVLGVWRHVFQRFPVRYDPAYWSMVFPLGMYATSTFQMQRAMNLTFLSFIPHLFLYLALAAWLAAFGGLLHTLAQKNRPA